MPKVLISDSMSNVAQKIFEKNNISVDIKTGLSIMPACEYYYKIDSGPSSEVLPPDEGMKISGKTLSELNNETLSDDINISEAKNLLSMILRKHINQNVTLSFA